MPVVTNYSPINTCAVSLPLYAQHLGIDECAFWGVNAGTTTGTCKTIWTLDNRNMLAFYLCQAQDEIEGILKYPLQPKWFTNEPHRMVCKIYLTDWKKVIAGGIRSETIIEAGAAIDDAADPNVIGPIATTVTDPDEIHIFHSGSEQEIIPSKITIAGGFVTIEIPLCRLILPAKFDNPPVGWNLSDLVFATTADVKRIYNDISTQAKFIKAHTCHGGCAQNLCYDQLQDGCIKVKNSEIGTILATPGTFADGAWSTRRGVCGCYQGVYLNYYAGQKDLTHALIDAIIRLAHSRMPHAPCGCDPIKRFWEADRNTPENMSSEREKCLFGMSDGAWEAWRMINNPGMRIMRAGVL